MTPASNSELARKPVSAMAPAEKAQALTDFFVASGIPWADEESDENASLDASLSIALRIAQAESVEEVLNPQSTISGQDLVGRPFVVRSLRLARSTFSGGLPFYMQLDVVFPDTGETSVVSCGSLNVMSQLAKLGQMNALGEPVVIEESENQTARGYKPLWLRSAAQAGA